MRNRIIERFCVVTLLLLSFSSVAQREVDIITLKDGKELRGTVVVQKPGKYIGLLNYQTKDTTIIPYNDISLITKVLNDPQRDKTESIDSVEVILKHSEPAFNKRKYYVGTYYSVMGGEWAAHGLGLNLLGSFTPRIQAGIGIAAQSSFSYNNKPQVGKSFPLTFEFRYLIQEMWKNRTAFLFCSSLGYNFIQGNDHTVGLSNPQLARLTNGFYFQSGLGFRLNFSPNVGCIIDVGYQYFNTKTILVYTDELFKKNQISNIIASFTLFY